MAMYTPDDAPMEHPTKHLTRLYRCECGRPAHIPILPEYTDPIFVERVEQENEVLRQCVIGLSRDLHELAKEALDAGFESSYMKRLSELAKMFRELKKRYGIEE